MRTLARLRDEWRLSAITLGAPAAPLLVLFGLNAVDELDRTAFAVLLPDIRDHFGLTDSQALAMVAATTVAVDSANGMNLTTITVRIRATQASLLATPIVRTISIAAP